MGQFVIEARIKNGHLELDDMPFPDDTELKIIAIPKVNLAKMSFPEIQKLTKTVKGNLSDDIVADRDTRG